MAGHLQGAGRLLRILGVGLAGTGAGYLLSQALPLPGAAGARDPFSLGLTVAESGDNLNVKWDHESPAIAAATTGVLRIEEGAASKEIELGVAQLRSGSIIYQPSGDRVSLLLEVKPRQAARVIQSASWLRSAARPVPSAARSASRAPQAPQDNP